MLDTDNLDLEAYASTPFTSSLAMQRAIRHPDYSRDPAFRAAVEAKIGLGGSLGITTSADNSTMRAGALEESGEATRVINHRFDRQSFTQEDADEAAPVYNSTDEEALAAAFGPQAVRPAARTQRDATTRQQVIGTHRASINAE